MQRRWRWPPEDVRAALLDVGIVLVRELLDEVVRLRQFAGVDHLFIGGIGVAPAQVVLDGAGEEDVLLQHHGHGVAQRFKVVLAHVHAADQHAALGDIVEAGDELHQRRFGRARAAEYAHHLAGLDVEVRPAQAEAVRVAGIAEIDVFKADGAILDFLDGVLPGSGCPALPPAPRRCAPPKPWRWRA